jgi:hypothetical protein
LHNRAELRKSAERVRVACYGMDVKARKSTSLIAKWNLSLFRRADDGMNRLSGKAKRHQHLRRTRYAVQYQTLCRLTCVA